jgi:hypothetical protein
VPCIYDAITCFSDGFNKCKSFSEGLAAVKKDGEWGYINNQGALVIKNKYASAGAFNNGIAIVSNGDGELLGYWVRDDKVHPSHVSTFGGTPEYYQTQGLIDKTGRVLVPLKYRIMSAPVGFAVYNGNDVYMKELLFMCDKYGKKIK